MYVCASILFDTREARRTVITQPVNVNGSTYSALVALFRLPCQTVNVHFEMWRARLTLSFSPERTEFFIPFISDSDDYLLSNDFN